MNRKKYYISMQSNEISRIPYGNNNEFVIYATSSEVRQLRDKMNHIGEADIATFWRAHVPFVPYHLATSNDDYDKNTAEAFQMIYDLGDKETKSHISSMGIFVDRHR